MFAGRADKPDILSQNPTDSARTPTREFRKAVGRRISRSSEDDLEPNIEALLTDALGRKPAVIPQPTDIPKTSKNPPAIRGMRPRNELTYDLPKERYREYRRVVYDFDYWANTRSSTRFFFHMLTLPSSRIIKDIAPATLFVTLFAAAIVADVPQAMVEALNIHIPQWLAVCSLIRPFCSNLVLLVCSWLLLSVVCTQKLIFPLSVHLRCLSRSHACHCP